MGLTQLLSIVLHESTRWDQLILVVSALDGITDQLIEASQFALMGNSRGYRRIVATLRTRHVSLIGDLPFGANERTALQTDIDRLLFDMHDACQQLADTAGQNINNPMIDRIIGTGERLAARIVAALLRQHHVRAVALDATDLIMTDDVFGSATPLMSLTQARIDEHLKPLLHRDIIPIITGFIGATPTGSPTTLGRGGSDYTASVIASCVDAAEVWIYADVDGILSGDPNDMANPRVIPFLSYDEVAELAFYGARILHARMITPLHEKRIPLRVKNVFKPQQPGTLIDDRSPTPGIKAVTMIEGLALSAPHSGSLSQLTAFMDEKFASAAGVRVEVMLSAQSAVKTFVCFVIPTYAGPDALHMLQSALAPSLNTIGVGGAWTMQPVGIVTVVGAETGTNLPQLAGIVAMLDELHVLAMTRNPSNCSVSFVLPYEEVGSALERIHASIVSGKK